MYVSGIAADDGVSQAETVTAWPIGPFRNEHIRFVCTNTLC